jgi:hypothetical protein
MAKANAAVEIKNNNQYKPLFLLRTSIRLILRKNRGEELILNNNILKTILHLIPFIESFYYFRQQCVAKTRWQS